MRPTYWTYHLATDSLSSTRAVVVELYGGTLVMTSYIVLVSGQKWRPTRTISASRAFSIMQFIIVLAEMHFEITLVATFCHHKSSTTLQ